LASDAIIAALALLKPQILIFVEIDIELPDFHG
jgi:hypothetical protein